MLGISSGLQYASSALQLLTPAQISVGNLALWLQFNTGITQNESDQVSKWDDQSGNGRHASQGVDVNKATHANGALDFESSESDHYDLAQDITISSAGGFCLAVVVELESPTGRLLSKTSNDGFSFIDGTTFRFNSSTTSTTTDFVFEANTFPTGSKMLIVLNRTAGGSNVFTIFKNGSTLEPDTDNSVNEAVSENPFGFGINVLGSSAGTAQFFDGKVYDVAFWDASLSETQLVDVNNYFKEIHDL